MNKEKDKIEHLLNNALNISRGISEDISEKNSRVVEEVSATIFAINEKAKKLNG